jgi:hypothetical protein
MKLRRSLAIASFLAVTAGMAAADTIGCTSSAFTRMDSIICQETPAIEPTAINWGPTSLNIQQFDPTLGTLNYVEIIAWANGAVTENVSNHSTTTAESFTNGTASISLAFSGTGFTTITLNPSASGLSGGPIAPGDVLNGTPQSISADTTAGGGTFIFNIGSLLAPFIGTGTIGNLQATGGPSAAGGLGGPDLFYNANGTVGGTLAVLYDYSPAPTGTPEPATMALMGGALVGIGMLGKRLKKG